MGMLNVFYPCAGRKKRRASRQSTDLGPLPSSAENPMAIMSYQPMDEQLNTQFLNLLSDHDNNGGLQPLRNPNTGGAGEGLSPRGLPHKHAHKSIPAIRRYGGALSTRILPTTCQRLARDAAPEACTTSLQRPTYCFISGEDRLRGG